MPDAPRRYSREEMQEILRRAIERQSNQGEITHDELVDAAREVGIDVDAVEHAAHELTADRELESQEAEYQKRRRHGFYRSLAVYAIVNSAIMALDLLTTGGVWWFAVAILWGIGVALHGLSVFLPSRESPEARKRRLEIRAEKEAKRAAAAARRAAKRARHEEKLRRKQAIRQGAEQFEAAVEQGVAMLLNGLAKQVQRGVDQARERPVPELGTHDDARLRSAGVDRVAPPPMRVRVDPNGGPARSRDEVEVESSDEARQRQRSRRT